MLLEAALKRFYWQVGLALLDDWGEVLEEFGYEAQTRQNECDHLRQGPLAQNALGASINDSEYELKPITPLCRYEAVAAAMGFEIRLQAFYKHALSLIKADGAGELGPLERCFARNVRGCAERLANLRELAG